MAVVVMGMLLSGWIARMSTHHAERPRSAEACTFPSPTHLLVTMPTPVPSVARVVQEVVKCKWSLQLLAAVRGGTARPMQLQRGLPGLSFKVMNERLTKLVRLGGMTRSEEQTSELPSRG